MVEKVIVVDISPISTSKTWIADTQRILNIINDIPLSLIKDQSLSLARKIINFELSRTIADQSLRAFILTNLIQTTTGR